MFQMSNWKNVNLAHMPAEEFARHFPLAYTADANRLTQLAEIYHRASGRSHRSKPIEVDLGVLHTGLQFGALKAVKAESHFQRLAPLVIQQGMAVAVWHLYYHHHRQQQHHGDDDNGVVRRGELAVLLDLAESPRDFGKANDPQGSRPFDVYDSDLLRQAMYWLLTLATTQRDEATLRIITQRWLVPDFPTAATQAAHPDQQDFLNCLPVNGLGHHATYLKAFWDVTYRKEVKPLEECSESYLGSRWIQVLPNGDVALSFSDHHFGFEGKGVAEPFTTPNPNPAVEFIGHLQREKLML
ncbi:hypothetical protein BJ085DRAFT_38891 [Dimargaris cristalligena]|uniref:Uncharacterized protein n=1 Tax=Dimargaris cristalligena TaxID=215637 RepID=A0A4P9ZW19_9FUNG|nr:hypothetical protein BJ085DRAFT_38891 [Dimargaris cristalligena]|eukprot:RKP37488.1 hypothetical protein BJ085DRAFT_38891 [Dimargaris cristalligena]